MSEWTIADVEKRIEACVSALEKLPSGIALGYSNFWPEIKYTQRELDRQKVFNIRLRPTPKQISEMEETLQWFQWINPGERNLVWLRAYRYSWREIARQTGFPKTSAQRYWQIALGKIAQSLNEKSTLSISR